MTIHPRRACRWVRGRCGVRNSALNQDTSKADFSATLTMELSDYTRNASNIDSTSATTGQMQHTHHIGIVGGTIAQIPTGGFQLSGPVTITKDGSPATTCGVDIIGSHHWGEERRVFKHYAAVPRWRDGSFWSAIDPRRGEHSGYARSRRPSDARDHNCLRDAIHFDDQSGIGGAGRQRVDERFGKTAVSVRGSAGRETAGVTAVAG